MAFSSQKNSTPEKGNNANDRSGEAILQDSNHQGKLCSWGNLISFQLICKNDITIYYIFQEFL